MAGKPKLERTNARKSFEYKSESPSAPRCLDKGVSKSFRVEGGDSQGEIEKLVDELGLVGGIDAFGIPLDAWEAGKSRTGSVDRFILDHTKRYSSLDESRIFDNDHGGSELATSPSGSSKSFDPRSSYSSSSSSRDSFQFDASSITDEKGIFGSFGLSSRQRFTRFSADELQDENHQETSKTPINEPLLVQSYTHGADETERLQAVIEQVIDSISDNHPSEVSTPGGPGVSPSAQTVVDLKPDEVRDDAHASLNLSEGSEMSPSEGNFVTEVLQQHSDTAKQQIIDTTFQPLERTVSISFNNWRKLEFLGSGSFGTVYEGLSEDGIYFAVKEVSLSDNDSKTQQSVTQLEQEIEFLSKFQHENIVRYYGTQKEPDKLYIFLELVTKGSLSSLYQKYNLFESQIRSYTRQILSGLKYLHDRKVMHRDIKCANILVDVNGKIKLADFGLAKQISQLDELKSCKGSAYWMAPEVVNPKQTYSLSADIWSLGCTVLEMATRRPPYGDLEWHRALWKVGHGEGPPIPEDVPEDAKDFINRCLETNPLKRPTAAQLLEHPFVKYAGTGLTPKNSFDFESFELKIIPEDKTLSC